VGGRELGGEAHNVGQVVGGGWTHPAVFRGIFGVKLARGFCCRGRHGAGHYYPSVVAELGLTECREVCFCEDGDVTHG
jgi:hypothetical protein